MAYNSKKKMSLKDYGVVIGIVAVVVVGFLFFTAKGKALKDKIVGFFKPKTTA